MYKLSNLCFFCLAMLCACQIEDTNFIQARPNALEATDITRTSFVANWTEVRGASIYFIDVATDIDFKNITESYNAKVVAGLSEKIEGLTIGETYFYRVRAQKDNLLSDNSNVVSVTVLSDLPAPKALAPSDHLALNFTLQWESVEDATTYLVDIATDSDFNNMVEGYKDREVLDTTLNFKHRDFRASYFYRVRAKRLEVTSAYSNTIQVESAISASCHVDTFLIDITPTIGDRQIFIFNERGVITKIQNRGKPGTTGEDLGAFNFIGYSSLSTRRHSGADWIINYNAQDQMTNAELRKINNNNLVETRVFAYNTNNQVVEVQLEGFDSSAPLDPPYIKRRWEFSYDAKGNIVEWRDYDVTATEFLASKYTVFYNIQGQATSITYDRQESPVGVYEYTYEYDESLNPLALFQKPEYSLFIATSNFPRYKPFLPLNNIVEEFVGFRLPNTLDQIFVYSFGFNAKGITTLQKGVPIVVFSLNGCE